MLFIFDRKIKLGFRNGYLLYQQICEDFNL